MDPAAARTVLAVGAIPVGSYGAGPIESFSSRGPTTDGRLKPETCGPDGLTTFTYGLRGAYGTSFAAPTVAGAAALVIDENGSLTVDGVKSALYAKAADMGAVGPDNTYGTGRTLLPLAATAPPPDTTPPAAPTGLAATAGDAAVSLAWTRSVSTDVASQRVYRRVSGGTYALVATLSATATAHASTGLTNGTPYFFVVRAVDGAGNESAASNEASATPRAPTSQTSTSLRVSSIAVSVVKEGPNFVARATVKVVDSLGRPVPGATVSGRFNADSAGGSLLGSGSAVTDSQGQAVVNGPRFRYQRGRLVHFTVTGVTKSGMTYDASGSAETTDFGTAR